MQRILIATPATLTATFYVGETPTDPSPATATVTITKADGTAVVTDVAATHGSSGVFTYALPAQSSLNYLTAVWTAGDGRKVTTNHEIVGGFYAELAEIRALDGLNNTSTYTTAKLEEARTKAENLIEDVTKVAWVPRYAREFFSGNGRDWSLELRVRPRTLISVSVDGAAEVDVTTASWVIYEYGRLDRVSGSAFPWGSQNVIVEYTHGFDAPPADLKEAFLRLCRHFLLRGNSRIDERATTISNDFGTMQLVTAGDRAARWVGLPDVDTTLNRYSYRSPTVA